MVWFWFQSPTFSTEDVAETFDVTEAQNRLYDLIWRPGVSVTRPTAPLRVILLAAIGPTEVIELPAENGYQPGGQVISFSAPTNGTGANEQPVQFSGITSSVVAVGCAILDSSMRLWQVIQFGSAREITGSDVLAIGTGSLSVDLFHTMP